MYKPLIIIASSVMLVTSMFADVINPTITVNLITNANISALANDADYTTTTALNSTNTALKALIAAKVTTNTITDKLVIGDGSVLTNVASPASVTAAVGAKVTTNAVLNKLQLVDGSSLTNVNAITIGSVKVVVLGVTNVLFIAGTSTNHVFLNPYTP